MIHHHNFTSIKKDKFNHSHSIHWVVFVCCNITALIWLGWLCTWGSQHKVNVNSTYFAFDVYSWLTEFSWPFNSCSVNWEIQTPNAKSYIIFLFIFGLVLQMIVIFYCYVGISITMSKTNRKMALRGQVERAERRVNAMIVLMISGKMKLDLIDGLWTAV